MPIERILHLIFVPVVVKMNFTLLKAKDWLPGEGYDLSKHSKLLGTTP